MARVGGDAAGNNLREADYGGANALNQLTTREVPGSLWLTGDAPTNLSLLGAVDDRDSIGEHGGINLYGFVGNSPIGQVDVLGLADFRNHGNIAMRAMNYLGIQMTPKQAECFRRGLVLPDVPFFDAGGTASRLPGVPVAGFYHMKANVSHLIDTAIDPAKQFAEKMKERYAFLDIDDPSDWLGIVAGPAAREAGRRFEYWWNDFSLTGPILTHTPFVKNWETVRTHWGDLAYHHGMGTAGMSASQVQGNITGFVNARLNAFRKMQCTDPCRAFMELGRALHTLTDSYAKGHVIRNDETGLIELFQDYNLQSLHHHESQDEMPKDDYWRAVYANYLMIQQAMGNSSIDSSGYFQTVPGAEVGVLRGTQKAGFWNTIFYGIPIHPWK